MEQADTIIPLSHLTLEGVPKNLQLRLRIWADLLGFMCWPEDEQNRQDWISYVDKVGYVGILVRLNQLSGQRQAHAVRQRKALRAQLKSLRHREFATQGGLLQSLLNGSLGGFVQQHRASMAEQFSCAQVAWRLLTIRASSTGSPGRPMLKDAVYLVQQFDHNGEAVSKSAPRIIRGAKQIENSWGRFKSVAHLWLAMYLLLTSYGMEKTIERKLGMFLALSVRLQTELEQLIGYRHLANRITIWRLPESVAAMTLEEDLPIRPLTDEESLALRQRAHRETIKSKVPG